MGLAVKGGGELPTSVDGLETDERNAKARDAMPHGKQFIRDLSLKTRQVTQQSLRCCGMRLAFLELPVWELP
jgi:hypothetical protein